MSLQPLKTRGLTLVILSAALLTLPAKGEDILGLRHKPLKTPAVPLMGILQLQTSKEYPKIDPFPDEGEIPVIRKMYKGLHVLGPTQIKESGQLWEALKEGNPDFMILPYFQSTLAQDKLGIAGKTVEEDPLNLISMYLEGVIDADLDMQTEKFKVAPENSEQGFGLRASTISDDFSKNTGQYITMLRINDEIMKIIGVDEATCEVTVIRGYKGTTAETHQAGSNVFAPVYRGKISRDTGAYGQTSSYPGYSSSGSKPQYHLRLDSGKTVELLSEVGADYIRNGATGLWLDLTSPNPFMPCNACGHKVMPWNFESNEEYTNSAYLKHQEIKCGNMRELIRQETGVFPQFVANNHAAGKYFKEGGGGVDLVRPTSQKPIPIEGVILEAAFCFYQTDEWFTVNKWKQNLSTLIHGCRHKYPVWPWIKSVKYAYLPMPKNEKSERFQLFDYASTLLGYERDAGVVCALPLHWVDDDGKRTLNLPEYLFYDIGEPVERVAHTEIDKMRVPAKNTYMRRWSKAIVFVNPTDRNDASVPVPEGYLDPALDKEVKEVSMPAHTGRILLKID